MADIPTINFQNLEPLERNLLTWDMGLVMDSLDWWKVKRIDTGEYKWEQGQPWEDWINPTIKIWTTTTLQAWSSASVVNVWTQQDMVLNFGIPKWENGNGNWDMEKVIYDPEWWKKQVAFKEDLAKLNTLILRNQPWDIPQTNSIDYETDATNYINTYYSRVSQDRDLLWMEFTDKLDSVWNPMTFDVAYASDWTTWRWVLRWNTNSVDLSNYYTKEEVNNMLYSTFDVTWTQTLDLNNYSNFNINPESETILSFSNEKIGKVWNFVITQFAIPYNVLFPAWIIWVWGNPTITMTPEAKDIFSIYYDWNNYIWTYGLDITNN